MSTTVLILSFFLLVLIGVPVCFSLGASAILYLCLYAPDFFIIFPQRIWAGAESYVMIALPLFILAGELMNRGGITQRLINFCLYIVRPLRGGLGEVNVVASMIFGGISGSSVADTSAIGTILIPSMVENGYDEGFSAGVTVASSTMGMIIPPSIPMLIYAMISEQSVGALFLAGLIPGLLVGVTQILMVYIISKRRHYHPVKIKFDPRHFFLTMRNGFLALIMPLVIIISVSFGIATASESAGVAVFYALFLGFVVYKELNFKDLVKALKKTILSSSTIMFVMAYSMMFIWILAIEQVPSRIGVFVQGLDISRIWILIAVDIFILVIGTFIDVSSAIVLLTPILIHIMNGIGVDSLQLGAILIVGLAIGLVTPPVGGCLFACTKICGLSVMKIAKQALPFIICNVIILILVTFIPGVSLWLPGLIMK